METNSEKKQYHEAELAKYERSLKTCNPSTHTAVMNMIVYHERVIRELDSIPAN
jgi:hypothetical protein